MLDCMKKKIVVLWQRTKRKVNYEQFLNGSAL